MRIIVGDVTKYEEIKKALNGVDVVYATFALIRFYQILDHELPASYNVRTLMCENDDRIGVDDVALLFYYIVGGCLLFVVCCLLFVVCCLLFVVCCCLLLFVVCCCCCYCCYCCYCYYCYYCWCIVTLDKKWVSLQFFIWKVNVKGTENVIKACQECDVKYLIQTSTSNVSLGYD